MIDEKKVQVIIENERDERTLAWLQSQFSDGEIIAAITSIKGRRRAYLSNVCKVLLVTPPDVLAFVPQFEGLERVKKLKELLRRGV